MTGIRRTRAVFIKQLKDTLKNKTILIQFIMFPLLTVIMVHTIPMKSMPENFFVTLFATMYVGMAPLTSMAAVIAEEKEMNTLRVLMMSNVKPAEYLTGTGLHIIVLCLAGAALIGAQGSYGGMEYLAFLAIMLSGILASAMIGAVIGIGCRSQMSAASVAVPAMMVFAFVPMIASFNTKVKPVSQFLYSQQVSDLIQGLSSHGAFGRGILIIGLNMAAAAFLFAIVYQKHGLRG